MVNNFFRSFLIFFLFLLFPAAAFSEQAGIIGHNLDAALTSAHASAEIPVIITFADQVTPSFSRAAGPSPSRLLRQRLRNEMVRDLRHQAQISQRDLKNFLISQDITIDDLWIINGLSINATPAMINTISQWPGVTAIRSNQTVSIPAIEPQAAATPEWNISAIGAPELWAMGLTGEGVVVASLDTGVDILHPDISSKWRGPGLSGWYDPNGEHSAAPYDHDGHGTSVMGVMVGGSASGTAIGVAPDAQWIAAKIFNDAGDASYAAIHLAYQWLLDPNGDSNTDDAPDIVNNSWALDSTAINDCITEFQPDIQALKAAGIAVVFAAGNFGPAASTSVSPSNYPESLAVGATDMDNLIISESGRGPSPCSITETLFPQISAPGFHIKIADLTLGGAIPDSYAIGDGTSLAAPHVSGLMALLLETDGVPSATVAELEEALKLSATDLGVAGPDNNYGYGLVNGPAALQRLTNQPPNPATLISPANGATGVDTTVTFVWLPAIDPDGNQVSEEIVLVELPQSAMVPFHFFDTLHPNKTALLSFVIIFLSSIFLTVRLRRNIPAVLLVLLATGSLIVINACGGGGGSAAAPIGPNTRTGLKNNTTYSWKIVSTDSLSAATDSSTWQFTTR